jgi:transposase
MGRRAPYPEEFKREAIALVTEQGMQPYQVAHDLGIDPDNLKRWLRDHKPATPGPDPVVTPAELARLRREHEQLRMERDIRTKATLLFSRVPQ